VRKKKKKRRCSRRKEDDDNDDEEEDELIIGVFQWGLWKFCRRENDDEEAINIDDIGVSEVLG